MAGRAWVVLDSSLSRGLKMGLVCVDYMSRYDMRVSPPSKSFGIHHIYALCKVTHIFNRGSCIRFALQVALNLSAALRGPRSPRGKGARVHDEECRATSIKNQ